MASINAKVFTSTNFNKSLLNNTSALASANNGNVKYVPSEQPKVEGLKAQPLKWKNGNSKPIWARTASGKMIMIKPGEVKSITETVIAFTGGGRY